MEVAEIHHTAYSRPLLRRIARALIGPVAVFLLTVCCYWKLVLTDQYTFLESPDLAYQVLPWFQFQAGELHAGRFPLWDPNHWGGQPLIGQAQPGVAYPPNWILFASSLKNGWLRQSHVHWYFVLIHFLGALFSYLLCRDLGRSKFASVLGGSLFGLTGYVGTTDWPQMINGAIWIPLVFLFQFRTIRGDRPLVSAVWSGVFLGVSWLSGHHQVPIFASLASMGVWGWWLLEDLRLNWERVRLVTVFGVFTALVGAFQILPAYEYGKLAVRWVGLDNPVDWKQKVPYNIHSHYSLPPMTLFGLVFPGMHTHSKVFMGLTATLMAVLGMLTARERVVRILLAVGALGLFFALGSWTGIHGILYALVPMVEKARSPNMAIVLVNFSLSIVSAWGIDYLLFNGASGMLRRFVWATSGFAAFVLSVAAAFALTGKSLADERFVVVGWIGVGLASLLWFRDRGSIRTPAVACCLVVFVLAEMGMGTTYEYPNRFNKDHESRLKSMSEHGEIAKFLQSRRPPIRVDVDDSLIHYNFGDWYGIETVGGYLASLTANLPPQGTYSQRTQQLMGVGYFVGKAPRFPDQVEVFRGTGALRVFASENVLPRAWSVHRISSFQRLDDVVRFNQDEQNNLQEQASLLGTAPELESCNDGDVVRLTQAVPGSVRMTAVMACRGMVVLGDTFYPGWKATVDGQPVRIYEAYGFLRGVVVDKGAHLVEFTYQPVSVYAGASMSGIGLLAALTITLVPGLTRRRSVSNT